MIALDGEHATSPREFVSARVGGEETGANSHAAQTTVHTMASAFWVNASASRGSAGMTARSNSVQTTVQKMDIAIRGFADATKVSRVMIVLRTRAPTIVPPTAFAGWVPAFAIWVGVRQTAR